MYWILMWLHLISDLIYITNFSFFLVSISDAFPIMFILSRKAPDFIDSLYCFLGIYIIDFYSGLYLFCSTYFRVVLLLIFQILKVCLDIVDLIFSSCFTLLLYILNNYLNMMITNCSWLGFCLTMLTFTHEHFQLDSHM